MLELDAIILGAGPAGISAALKLAALGRTVAVVSCSDNRGHCQLETVPNLAIIAHACHGLCLDMPGVIDFSRSGVSWWTGVETATNSVAVLDRRHFDAALLAHAKRLGVAVHMGEKSSIHLSMNTHWQVSINGEHFRGRYLVDATGRHSSLRKREVLTSWKQVGIVGKITLNGDVPGLWTESVPDGWLWAIRGAGNEWVTSIFVDPSSLRENARRVWECMLGQSRLADRILSCAASPTKIEVSPVAAPRICENGILHLGDAALARDPLASQGLTAAVSDGQSAAIAVHTLLSDSSREDIVIGYLDERHRHARQSHVDFLSDIYADGPFETAFWAARREGVSTELSEEPPVQVELDCLLARSSQWSVHDCPVLEDDSIHLAPCLCSGKESVRWLAGRPIQDFLPPANKLESPRSLLAQWRHANIVRESTAFQVLKWLTNRGILERADPGI